MAEYGVKSEDCYDEVVAGLYEAALSPDRWHGALSAVMRYTRADTFHFNDWDRQEATAALNIFSHEWMTSGIGAYASYYGAIDPRRRLTESLPVGSVFACHHHISDSSASRDEFYQDFLIPHGLRYVAGSRVFSDDRRDVIIGLMREVGNRPFSEHELHDAQRLISHLSRASRLWMDTQTLHTAATVGAQGAVASAFALIAVDARGKVAYANARGERLMSDGDCLVTRDGCIGASFGKEDTSLRQLVRQVLATGCGASLTLSGIRSGPQSLLLSIAPLRSSSAVGADLAGASVLITARARLQPVGLSANALAQAFGLTAAESAVALALCEGKTPEEHAQAVGVSLATVRTQLRAVFDKTQTRRQSETVGLLLGIPPSDDPER
jgi:DNA-binding CsgD family transcriptional regulator